MKIAFYDTKPYDKESFDKYKEKYGVSFKYFETKLNEDTTELAKGFDGVCIFVNDTVNANVIDALYNMGVKQVYLRCSGFNNIDMKYAKDKLHIMRVPAYSPYAVAEHAIALLLTLVRRTHKGYIRSRDFNFSLNGLTGFDLYNKTVGVIGTGKIGEVFINICRGFGMKVLAFDKYPKKDLENGDTIRYVDMNTLLKSSDIISLHCPLTDETQYIINEKSLKKIKKGVIIINTSRGALVDTEALLNGIKSRKIGGACLDVYEEESDVFFEDNSGHIMDDDILARLISMPNVILTSHQAFLTEEALQNIAKTTLENITAFSKTGSCANEISYKKGLI
ncbi:MAG: 2-hydroxyacid dehydrogenase [Ruminococcaceae bacterium]|nr:2-hydroxyacid dehydrogenase [Oscillospiraceae bacterium]